MSREHEWRFRVAHIVGAIEKILRYTHDMTFEAFSRDERTVDAVVRNFLVIGEAAGHVPVEIRTAIPHVPWKLMEGMRHVLVHDYETVRLDIIWKTVVEDLPALLPALRESIDRRA